MQLILFTYKIIQLLLWFYFDLAQFKKPIEILFQFTYMYMISRENFETGLRFLYDRRSNAIGYIIILILII